MIGPVSVLGASFYSTHHMSAADLLAGRERPQTPPSYGLLVGRARRFTSLVTQLHVEVCGALPMITEKENQLTVFATRHGEIQTAAAMIAGIQQGAVSGARFALSVHNTAAGLHSVATGNHGASTTVTGKNAIAAGWLEAVLTVHDTGRTVLLSIADEPVPEIFQYATPPYGVAAAFLLGPVAEGARQAQLDFIAGGDADVEPAPPLARAVVGDATAIDFGPIQPGMRLSVRA